MMMWDRFTADFRVQNILIKHEIKSGKYQTGGRCHEFEWAGGETEQSCYDETPKIHIEEKMK